MPRFDDDYELPRRNPLDRMSFDSKCHELALHFLADSSPYDDYSDGEKTLWANRLAQHIQDHIEEFITFDLPKTHIEPETAEPAR